MSELWISAISLILSGGVGIAAGKWFAGRAVDHALAVHLKMYQAQLDSELTRLKAALEADARSAQARLEATLRVADERVLGEEAAEREYRFEARKRLYTAIGPLRFQLLIACSQYLSRIESFGDFQYDINLKGYFGRSLLYRIGRLIAITELIEWQTSHADFSVDPDIAALLRFRNAILKALSGAQIVLNHPAADWINQKEHIFRDTLNTLAVSMITKGEKRVVRFDEFSAILGDGTGDYLQPLARIISSLCPSETPILWLRLLGLAQACEGLLTADPTASVVEVPRLEYGKLIGLCQDTFVRDNAARYHSMLTEFRSHNIGLPTGDHTTVN